MEYVNRPKTDSTSNYILSLDYKYVSRKIGFNSIQIKM